MIEEISAERAAAAVAAVDTLLYDVEDDLGEITSRIREHVAGEVAGIAEGITPSVTRLYVAADVNLPGDDQAEPLDWSAAKRLQEAAADALLTEETELANVAMRANEFVTNQVTALLPTVSEILPNIIRLIGNVLDGLLGNLSQTADFWASAATVVGQHIEQHHDKVTNTVVVLLSALFDRVNERSTDPGEVAGRLQQYLNRPRADGGGTVEDYIALLQQQPRFVTNLANVATAIATIHSWLSARNAAFLQGVRQAALFENPTSVLGAGDLVDMVLRRLVGREWAENHARRSGLSPELFGLLVQAGERLLSVEQTLEMWRRTGNDDELDNLFRLGFSQESVAALRTMAEAVATPSDVVRFLVRDVFDPDAVRRGDLMADFDAKYNERAFREAGVSRELAGYYWAAHWQLPSPTQGYEMLHRVQDFTQDDLRALLKAADYAPGYVDKLIAISYNTPGRIDIRRMYETGIISAEDLPRYYGYLGYNPEHSEILSRFALRLKEIADESKAGRKYGRIATELVRSVLVGTLSPDGLRSALESLGFTAEQADLRAAEAEYGRQRERADKIRDAIGARFIRGYLTEEQAQETLRGYAFDDTEIVYLLDSWKLDRELREETDAERAQKDLTKSEILAALSNGLLSDAEAADMLSSAGYDSAESTLLIQLENAKTVRRDAAAIEATARTQFIRRRITAEEARSILEGAGVKPTRVAALLSRWIVEAEEARPDISPAQLERMLMQGVIPLEEIEERLRQKGYTEDDISALLTLYGTDVSISEEKLRIQQEQFRERIGLQRELGTRRLDLTERGQNLQQERFTESQQALQQRFETTTSERARLQGERLDAQRTLQAERLAVQVERDAAKTIEARAQQERSLDASMQRLLTQIEAADRRQQAALQAREAANELRERLAGEARAAQDAALTRRLEAQAAQQQRAIDAADRRAEEARNLRIGLQQQQQAFTLELTDIRDQLARLREIRQNAARIATETRAEQRRIRQENRQQARRDITSAEAAQQEAALRSVQLRQSAAIAEVNAQFSALLAQVSDQRQRQAAEQRAAAEQALARATPATSLLDSVL